MATWKLWVLWGLVVQVIGVIPPAIITQLPTKAKFNQEVGVVVAIEDKPDRKQNVQLVSDSCWSQ